MPQNSRRRTSKSKRKTSRGYVPCKSHQYRRRTKPRRCLNKSKRKQIRKTSTKRRRASPVKQPKEMGLTRMDKQAQVPTFKTQQSSIPEFNRIFNQEGFYLKGVLGTGANGTVYEACRTGTNVCDSVVKVSSFIPIKDYDEYKRAYEHELSMGNLFYQAGIGPKMYGMKEYNIDNKYVLFTIHMDRIDKTLLEYLSSPKTDEEMDQLVTDIFNLLDVMCKNKLLHRDIHPTNLAYTYSGELILIDFGTARQGSCEPIYETEILAQAMVPKGADPGLIKKSKKNRLTLAENINDLWTFLDMK